jgi:predicted deacylase
VTRHEAIARLARTARAEILATVDGMPIHAFRFGVADRRAPTLLITGGVHGLERIGTDLALAYLNALISRDALAHRVLVIPLVNPVGMARGTRSNGRGVDLMRNAPPAATGGTPLLGGQRISPRLPWFMGYGEMELEARTLVEFVEAELFSAPYAIALDLHSGFGFDDRLWYPYARTREAPADLAAIEALARRLDRELPNHAYKVEQTARAYTIRGDLWDYLYDRRRAAGGGTLLPLTLEMGSWSWGLGQFNPRKPSQTERVLARHLPLLDFLIQALPRM